MVGYVWEYCDYTFSKIIQLNKKYLDTYYVPGYVLN